MPRHKKATSIHYLDFATRITQTLINNSEDPVSAKAAAKMFNEVHKDIAPPAPAPQPEVNNEPPTAESASSENLDVLKRVIINPRESLVPGVLVKHIATYSGSKDLSVLVTFEIPVNPAHTDDD